MDNWLNNYEPKLRLHGYECDEMQYRWNDEHGFLAHFMAKGMPGIQIVTHSEEVQRAIVKYEPK